MTVAGEQLFPVPRTTPPSGQERYKIQSATTLELYLCDSSHYLPLCQGPFNISEARWGICPKGKEGAIQHFS